MRRVAFVVFAILTGCRIEGTFECGLEGVCRRGDEIGTCEAEGYCSFGDAKCASGRRFADNAGDGLASQCVGETAQPLTCLERWHMNVVTFGAVADLGVNSQMDDRDPWLDAAGTKLYFSSNRQNQSASGHDLYVATRPDVIAGFGAPALIPALNSPNEDSHVSLSADGLTAYLATNRGNGQGGNDIWRATRTTVSAAFAMPDQATVGQVSSALDEYDPHLSSDGLHLYFARGQTGQVQRLMLATRATTSVAFAAATAIPELDTAGNDADPSVSPDELLMVFTSKRAAPAGGTNLWYTTRASATDAWMAPRIVPDVNADGEEGDPALSSDGCLLVFARSSSTMNPYDLVYAA